MAMRRCFDGLLPPRRESGVAGVSGVSPNIKTNVSKELAPSPACNTRSTSAQPRVSAKPIDLLAETPATPETPWREMYEERAGAMEYEAGFPRDKAEVMAYWDTFAQFACRQHSTLVAEFEAKLHRLWN